MHVGVCKLHFRLPENSSLKGKRQIIKPIIARIRNKYEVAVAEVGDQEDWHLATVGVCCIANDAPFANEVLSHVVNFVEAGNFDVEMLDYEIELLTV
jgi:uncharacterized protein